MKFENAEQPRDGERASSSSNLKKCAPKSVFGISMCCCLLGCLLPGIGLLGFNYLTYGNYESVQARVVGQTFCGYYRRRNLKHQQQDNVDESSFAMWEDEDEKELMDRRLKKSGYNSGSRSSSTNKKQNHYKMTYEFLTLEGENITTTTDYCVKARRPINSTEYIMYDPDDPYNVVHETKTTAYLVLGVSLAATGAVFLCAACVLYKVFMSTFGDMLGSNSNNSNNNGGMPDPTENNSESNHGGGGIPATTGFASAFSQFTNPNANNSNSATNNNNNSAPNSNTNGSNNNGGNNPMAGLASVFSQFTNPNANANNNNNSTAPNNNSAPNNNQNHHNNNANNNPMAAGLASMFSQFTNPSANSSNNNATAPNNSTGPTTTDTPASYNNNNAYGNTTTTENNNPYYGNTNGNNNSNNNNNNSYGNTASNPYQDNNNSTYSNNIRQQQPSPSAPPASAVNPTGGYRPP